MGSCVSKKKARAPPPPPPPPPPEHRPPPPPEEEEEKVKEVLSETPLPKPSPQTEQPEKEASEACSAAASALSAAAGGEGVEQRRPPTPEKTAPARAKKSSEGTVRSLAAASRSQRNKRSSGCSLSGELGRPRREQPAVVAGIGCRSGRFSPTAAKRAAEGAAVRRTSSAREAEVTFRTPAAKRTLNTGNAYGGSGAVRRDAGERPARRPESPAAKRAAAKTVGEVKPPQWPVRREGTTGGEEVGGGLENPSVAMECFIFL